MTTTSLHATKVGRRYYFDGAPYSARDALKSAGCRWDPQRRAWWTGKAATAALVEGQAVEAPAKDEAINVDSRSIAGRVQYKGRSYYLLAERRDGTGAKVCFRDGSRVFWTQRGVEYTVTKRYRELRSISQLRAYAEQAKEDQARYGYIPVYGRDYCGYPCPVSGVRCTPDHPCHDCE